MKYLIFLFLVSLNLTLTAQDATDCEKLAIEIHGLVDSENSNQIFIESSNTLYSGNLYHYPGFLLLNEEGDTIAQENVTYYGIGTGFYTHLLEIKDKMSFPFNGRLELFGSNYQKLFCSFPIELEELDYVSLKDIKNEKIKIVPTINEDYLILDLGGNNINAEKLDYHFNITNEYGEITYNSTLDLSSTSIPIKEIGGEGIYFISVWDGIKKKLLPTKLFEVE